MVPHSILNFYFIPPPQALPAASGFPSTAFEALSAPSETLRATVLPTLSFFSETLLTPFDILPAPLQALSATFFAAPPS